MKYTKDNLKSIIKNYNNSQVRFVFEFQKSGEYYFRLFVFDHKTSRKYYIQLSYNLLNDRVYSYSEAIPYMPFSYDLYDLEFWMDVTSGKRFKSGWDYLVNSGYNMKIRKANNIHATYHDDQRLNIKITIKDKIIILENKVRTVEVDKRASKKEFKKGLDELYEGFPELVFPADYLKSDTSKFLQDLGFKVELNNTKSLIFRKPFGGPTKFFNINELTLKITKSNVVQLKCGYLNVNNDDPTKDLETKVKSLLKHVYKRIQKYESPFLIAKVNSFKNGTYFANKDTYDSFEAFGF